MMVLVRMFFLVDLEQRGGDVEPAIEVRRFGARLPLPARPETECHVGGGDADERRGRLAATIR
jgi:hypothetical protein